MRARHPADLKDGTPKGGFVCCVALLLQQGRRLGLCRQQSLRGLFLSPKERPRHASEADPQDIRRPSSRATREVLYGVAGYKQVFRGRGPCRQEGPYGTGLRDHHGRKGSGLRRVECGQLHVEPAELGLHQGSLRLPLACELSELMKPRITSRGARIATMERHDRPPNATSTGHSHLSSTPDVLQVQGRRRRHCDRCGAQV
jgi:hypothetical protein